MTERITDNPLYLAAVHESGHVVVGDFLGYRILEVKLGKKLIYDDEGYAHPGGYVSFTTVFKDEGGARRRKQDPLRRGILLAAGDAAMRMRGLIGMEEATSSDHRLLRKMGFAGSSLATLRMHATAILKQTIPRHRNLVHFLLRRHPLDEKDVREFMADLDSQSRWT